ncbi:MAG: efflux RND transporter periplasmic adaptor subunit [Desulfovibrio sp.]|jgi:multidrug efflux system membrane fusion protein|nr:efflux RND transporter periplasmic adaptor subunit [Desulfovibrio sp.]
MWVKHCVASRFVWLFILGLPLLAACSGPEDKKSGPPPAPVRVSAVLRSDVQRLLFAVGNVKSSATVEVKSRVTGEIRQVHFTEGQDVKEGQPLITLDQRPFEAVLREKSGMLAKDQAQLNKAEDDMRRYSQLAGGGYVSREAYDKTVTDVAALRATVQADKAAVESAALDLSYCAITAPIAGRVGALNVDKGNMIKNTDATPIVTIDALSPIYVIFSVPEARLPLIQERMAEGPVQVHAVPTGGAEENGVLTLVDNSVDTRTGTIRLRANFDNQSRRLWPGQFVQVQLPLGTAKDVLTVPNRAVQAGRDESYVYVVDKDNRAVYRKVVTLFEYQSRSVIEGEIAEGERVVVEGQVRLAPGASVQILP